MSVLRVLGTGIAAFALGVGALVACSNDPSTTGPGQADAQDDVSQIPDAHDAAVPDVAQDADRSKDAADGATRDATDAATRDATDATTPDAADATTPDASDGANDGQDAAEDEQDAGTPDAECTGLRCNGQCVSDDNCRSCTGATLLCAATHTCVSSCAGCTDTQNAAMPIGCYACDPNHENPVGTCQYDDAGAYCLSGSYFGAYPGGVTATRCPCTDAGVGACPGATQVCVPLGQAGTGTSFCLTCGEVTTANLQGQSCMGGGTCQSSQRVCQ